MTLRFLALALAFSSPAWAQSSPPPTEAPQSQQSTPATGVSSQDLPDAPSTTSQAKPPVTPTGPTAVIDTTMGRLTCKLYDTQAPVTVANFIGLAEGTKDWTDPKTLQKVHGQPFYNGTTFHRVIPGFMIQGGDRLGDGRGDPGYLFKDEIDPSLTFDEPGRLAMANSGPSTNGSQFFITEAPVPHLNGKHTIFGQCDSHTVLMVATIARVQRDDNDKPVTPVVINKITIVRDGQPIPPEPAPPAAQPPAAPPQ
ncbi:peptidylprolyl isomerase [Edaphobacter albus]|uniref:peptidylprolyl isomerase n=1 Tax=Edaphobacter sp. 4G125 TaxID=2763071 RepID=UPI001643FC7E|nr:peptidylprolyl isomerase [Edaphobacter sp. 4G125]QNI38270.1 peptidylprolyl isomerase [Edaphobacter sp. 4G125]